jgi:hypothetical protein
MINPSTSYTIPFVAMVAGVPTDAASTPTAVLWRNGSAEATSVTVSTTSNTGIYHAAFTTGAGWAKSDRIWLVISATISSVAYRGIVWDSFSEPDAVMRGTDGANTTTPPTAAAIADTTLSGLTSGPTTGGNWPNGSFGRRILVGSSTQREVAVTGSHHVAADIHELQPAVITSAGFATDAISSDAVSSGAIGKIAAGVWSALTSGFNVSGSAGAVLKALDSMLEFVGGLWRWKATSLTQVPSGTSTVAVLPALGVAAGRGDRTTLVAYVAETITTSITVYQADGTTAYNLSGKTLAVIFENPKTGDDVAVVASGSITISGTDSNVVAFAYPSAATSAQRELTWTMRDASAPRTVYLRGVLEVRAAATVD